MDLRSRMHVNWGFAGLLAGWGDQQRTLPESVCARSGAGGGGSRPQIAQEDPSEGGSSQRGTRGGTLLLARGGMGGREWKTADRRELKSRSATRDPDGRHQSDSSGRGGGGAFLTNQVAVSTGRAHWPMGEPHKRTPVRREDLGETQPMPCARLGAKRSRRYSRPSARQHRPHLRSSREGGAGTLPPSSPVAGGHGPPHCGPQGRGGCGGGRVASVGRWPDAGHSRCPQCR